MSYILAPRNRPLRLRPDNFTPPARTPWGGQRIVERYKSAHGVSSEGVVGESWELGVEPDFPTRLADGRTLADVIAEDPEGLVGDEGTSTALLVKLLDAAEPLSVQIHPADDDPALAADESGKPESWYVLDADPGAGLYLGLADDTDEATMRAALEADGDVSALLRFVPVSPGDFFVIEAGTPHAIGPGLTLVEPQRVMPGRRGLTYRYWDWNRRYDANGRPDPDGAPRALHVERALAVTAWERCRGEAWLQSIRVRAGAPDLPGAPQLDELTRTLDFPWLGVARWAGTGDATLPSLGRLRALTVIEGSVTVFGEGFSERFERGETAALPAALAADVRLEGAHALVSWIPR
ncbi:MAG: class I mannose-6-phosphate isomerase [Sandaracinus sp.]|nr:class I mannose-6-phosphate isomerase [Myxococcales bacterium]MCB9614909.1 class I mannose-6-phosphate isomerase [Sandaracinus sp.]MCB9618662.1 class I mannose-6-phosphate isomerase [Sandaracinus sp.]